MRWTSWLPHSRHRRLCVVGLDIGSQACSLVILSGTVSQPDSVCCAEHLRLPDALSASGEDLLAQSAILGQWLRAYLTAGDYQPTLAYLGIDRMHVSNHLVTLAAALSPDDVAFQLQAELQLLLPTHVTEVCMDYSLDTEPAPVGQARYMVQVVPRWQVDALQRVALAAGLTAEVVEPRQDALRRTEHSHVFATLPQASVALALQCDAAFGLALRAWHDVGANFLPYRETRRHARRRAWLLGLAVCVIGGAFLAAGFALVMASAAQAMQPNQAEVEAVARELQEAQNTHAQAKADEGRRLDLARWFTSRQAVQSQSLQWSRVLSQATTGVWVASVKQQGTRWTVHGEALSASHAQQLMQQLKALEIWTQIPEMRHLQVMPEPSATGLPVWQFRIEASLKGET